jgi:C_GCAxxG_C_C family probable redox protein
MCGAASGGIMAISLCLGRNSPSERREQCYAAEQRFLKGFWSHFGELNCQELTGVDLGTPEGQAAFKEKGQIKQCTEFVGEAVRIVLEVIG